MANYMPLFKHAIAGVDYDSYHGPYTAKDYMEIDSSILFCAMCNYRDLHVAQLQEAIADKKFDTAKTILAKVQELEAIVSIISNRTSTATGMYTYKLEPKFHPKRG